MIGASIVIKGDVSGEEDLLVEGRVEGTIELKQSNLTIGKDGHVHANVQAKVITIEGRMEGDVTGEERIVIRQTGDVRGNVVAPRVHLEDGAKFKGSIDMEPKSGVRQGSLPQHVVDQTAAQSKNQKSGESSTTAPDVSVPKSKVG